MFASLADALYDPLEVLPLSVKILLSLKVYITSRRDVFYKRPAYQPSGVAVQSCMKGD